MTNHVVFDAAAQTMRCHHCGAAEALRLPTPILEACHRMDAFNDAHKDCPALYAEIDRLKEMNAELADMAALYLRYSYGRGLVGNKSREKLEAIIAKARGQQ